MSTINFSNARKSSIRHYIQMIEAMDHDLHLKISQSLRNAFRMPVQAVKSGVIDPQRVDSYMRSELQHTM